MHVYTYIYIYIYTYIIHVYIYIYICIYIEREICAHIIDVAVCLRESDFVVWLVAFLATLFTSVTAGIAIAVLGQ